MGANVAFDILVDDGGCGCERRLAESDLKRKG
jgi:hypothetical protein